jgi:hypothetical protein
LLDGPKLSEVERDDVLTLIQFSDVQPDRKTMFRTNDPVFMRLADLSKQGPLVIDKLMLDDLCQLAMLSLHFQELWNELQDLAGGSGWTDDMLAVELFLSNRRTEPTYSAAASFAKAAAGAIFPDGTPLSNVLLAAPRLSTMLAEEALAFEIVRPRLPDPDSLIDKQFTPNPSSTETGRILAKHALEQLPEDAKKRITHGYILRRDALRELTRRRIFVKRDILEHLWPNLYDLMRRDFAGLLQFEKQILQPDTCTQEELAKILPYLQNERLVRVFQLQPYFGHLLDGTTPPPEAGPGQTVPNGPASAGKATASESLPAPPATPTIQPTSSTISTYPAVDHLTAEPGYISTAPAELSPVQYEDIHVSVERMQDGSYQASLKFPSDDRETTVYDISLDWAKIREQVQKLQFFREGRDGALSAHPDFTTQLKKLGLMVYDSIFKGSIRRELLGVLDSSRNVRLHWLGDPLDPASSALPWESLFVPSAPVSFLALTRKYSLTRRYVEAKSMPVSPVGQKVRVLFVTANPSMVAPLPGVDQEITTLKQVLGSSPRANFHVITKATVDAVRNALNDFRPHVFHFSGHGRYNPEVTSGELILQTEKGRSHLVTSDQLGMMLYENDVALALLNGCDTGVSSTNDALSSVAGALVKAGVPAVIATMREVMDEAAARFSREFYRSFIAGFTVEASIGEARKALNLDNWDWSSYALFVGSADLSRLRVSGSARSSDT